jgi:hypothetical protein
LSLKFFVLASVEVRSTFGHTTWRQQSVRVMADKR